jgi:hypothetical protein
MGLVGMVVGYVVVVRFMEVMENGWVILLSLSNMEIVFWLNFGEFWRGCSMLKNFNSCW